MDLHADSGIFTIVMDGWSVRLFVLVVLAACRHPSTGSSDAAPSAIITPPVASASVAPAAPREVPRRTLLRAWNDAHSFHDAAALGDLYADTVFFYGARLSRAECVARLAAAMKKHPDEKQVVGDVIVEGDKLAFTKSITDHGKTAEYHAYLTLEQRDAGGWVIATESDTWSDRTSRGA